jgi:serine/threonine protein kinase
MNCITGKTQQGEYVALKKLKGGIAQYDVVKEVEALSQCEHENIVKYLGVYSPNGKEVFIVMEFLSRGSLDSVFAVESDNITILDLLAM